MAQAISNYNDIRANFPDPKDFAAFLIETAKQYPPQPIGMIEECIPQYHTDDYMRIAYEKYGFGSHHRYDIENGKLAESMPELVLVDLYVSGHDIMYDAIVAAYAIAITGCKKFMNAGCISICDTNESDVVKFVERLDENIKKATERLKGVMGINREVIASFYPQPEKKKSQPKTETKSAAMNVGAFVKPKNVGQQGVFQGRIQPPQVNMMQQTPPPAVMTQPKLYEYPAIEPQANLAHGNNKDRGKYISAHYHIDKGIKLTEQQMDALIELAPALKEFSLKAGQQKVYAYQKTGNNVTDQQTLLQINSMIRPEFYFDVSVKNGQHRFLVAVDTNPQINQMGQPVWRFAVKPLCGCQVCNS